MNKKRPVDYNASTFNMVLVFFLCLLVKGVSAQTASIQIDSLEKAFEQAKSDTAKFNISLDLIDRYKNIDSAKANTYLLKAEKLGKTSLQKVRYLSAKAAFLIVYGKMEKANALLFEALKIAIAKHYKKDEARIYNNLGVSYLQLSNNKLSLKYQLLALKIREELNDEAELEASNINIGNIYFDIMEDDKALLYYQKALSYAEKLGMEVELGKLYNNIATVFYDRNDYKQTKSYLLKSLTYKLKTHNVTGQITTLNSLGDVCSSLKSFKESEDYYRQAMALANKIGDDMNKANILNSLGHLYRYKNEFEKAVSFQEQALKLSKEIKYQNMHKDALLELSIDYRNLKNYQKAYEFYREYVSLKDSIENESSKTAIAELQTKYDTEHKEQKIALLNKENTIQKLALQSKNLSIGIIISIFCIALIMGILFYNSYKLKQQKALQAEIHKQQEIATKAVFDGEQQERIRIARDLHDSIGQMLSVVKMNLSTAENTDNKTLQLVDKTIAEVRNISHNLIPEELNFGLVNAIEDMCSKINTGDQPCVKLHIAPDIRGIKFLRQNELSIYRIVQEVLGNMLKHANATEITLEIEKINQNIQISIKDNGQGFDTEKISQSNGLGWKNISARVNLLDGEMKIASEKLVGTRIEILIPS
ncbi:tetratricopeptide repeat protein (plasmid) [Pedobacter sp. BS3]|uniref:tetratricopeptide repeat-containing sensor histidine kinase n=1 Tax=Pedobacter sp. BS3 TaxID=2567937 RepID=UPI0011EEFA2F|nr:sensor histidine kinase [Pedobacter sp. BS3]TZF86317.1 tetratricopeptide repeat protein [Pedobacter sp. BS3]